MEFIVLEPSIISLAAIAIIIIALIIAYVKKIMVTYALIITNFLVFLLTFFFHDVIIRELGFSSSYLSLSQFPQIYTLLTSMFVHNDFFHILGNMFVFFFMGVAFEQRIGRKKFFIIYILTGIFAALTQTFVNWGHPLLLVGASGAIFGILGAFAYSYPRDEVVMPVPVGIMFVMRIKVIYATILFALFETLVVWFSINDNTAHFAHLGGLISGVVIAAVLVGQQGARLKKTDNAASYDYMKIRQSDAIDFTRLDSLATTPELKNLLLRIKTETVNQVRDAWLEHFIQKTTCPVCRKPLQHFNRDIWCESQHFKTTY
jgi:membrane associated rhomboid family serine protease